ncbi:histidine kinase [Salinirubellus salinus]|uniref:histidine kinase n=1 Tax=Salinirubellus salinus TaxID=1364945 RepID=A0A9E7R1B7_9EURY|nr:histidine kinase N-terminal 7TM domain-containing protein [Salinirubellus salinus]UWM53454.1 histidine kinase [Salinirubellus salinus]
MALFGLAAFACFGSLWRVHRLENPEIRRGLAGLLVTSGLWAAIETVRLMIAAPELKIGLYTVGLAIGLATVGAWLYFCSAYAGHDYHRQSLLRTGALSLYLTVVVVKLTNPLHQQYFSASVLEMPYPHLVVELLPPHWIVTGIAYALSAVGLYMLYDTLHTSRYATASLGVVVSLTALPVGLTLAGHIWSTVLLELSYEPVGVAAFAVGVVYFVEEKFVAVPTFGRQQVIDNLSDPVVLLDREGEVQDYNPAAIRAFPALDGEVGRRLEMVAPDLLAASDERGVLTLTRDSRDRYYVRNESPITVGSAALGRALVFVNVTDVEQQRQELERQNEQLDGFADAINHELRNTLAIVQGSNELAATRLPQDADPVVAEMLETVDRTADRMARVVGDLSLLARHGQSLDAVSDCPFQETVERAWRDVAVEGLTLTTDGDGIIEADYDRLVALLTEAFQFAATTDSTTVAIKLRNDQVVVTTDGESIPARKSAEAFEYNAAVPSAQAGMALPNIMMLARVHGWSANIDAAYEEGVRLVVRGLSTERV